MTMNNFRDKKVFEKVGNLNNFNIFMVVNQLVIRLKIL